MKILEELVKHGTIEEFADNHGLEMSVKERSLPVGDPTRYYARFQHVDVMGDGVLIGTFGNGATKEEAIAAYAEKISMKTLIFHGNTPREQRIPAWRFEDNSNKIQWLPYPENVPTHSGYSAVTDGGNIQLKWYSDLEGWGNEDHDVLEFHQCT